MLKLHKFFLLFSFFLIPLNLMPSESKTCIPGEVFAYLKTKEVPYELKQELDKIFYLPEVMESLSKVYTQKGSGLKMLDKGFTFLKPDMRIFMCEHLPNLVFKIGFKVDSIHNEFNNVMRIKFAEIINEKGKGIVRAPKKYAYMPYLYKSEFIDLPCCIVIAEYIEKDCELDIPEAHNILKSLEYWDTRDANIFQVKDYCVVIDTEPFNIDLEYPEIS